MPLAYKYIERFIFLMSSNNGENGSIWDLIRSCERVNDIIKFEWKNKVRKVKTTENAVLVWAHYHRDHNFFGWSINKREKLKMAGLPLLHAFIGSEGRYYIVPDEDIESEKFNLSTQNRDYKHRKLNKSQHNQDILDGEYSQLEPFFGSTKEFEQ